MYIHRFLKFYKSGDVRIVVSLEATGRTCLLSHYKAIKSFFFCFIFCTSLYTCIARIHSCDQTARFRQISCTQF